MLSFVNVEKLSQSSSWLLLPLLSEQKKARSTLDSYTGAQGERHEGIREMVLESQQTLNCIENSTEMCTEVKIPPRAFEAVLICLG